MILTICRCKDTGIICKYLIFNIINTIIFQTRPKTFLKFSEKLPYFKTTNCDFDARQNVNWWKEGNRNFNLVDIWMEWSTRRHSPYNRHKTLYFHKADQLIAIISTTKTLSLLKTAPHRDKRCRTHGNNTIPRQKPLCNLCKNRWCVVPGHSGKALWTAPYRTYRHTGP